MLERHRGGRDRYKHNPPCSKTMQIIWTIGRFRETTSKLAAIPQTIKDLLDPLFCEDVQVRFRRNDSMIYPECNVNCGTFCQISSPLNKFVFPMSGPLLNLV